MSVLDFLRRRRRELDERLTARGLAHTFSLVKYQCHVATLPLLTGRPGDTCLDAGSGRSPYKELLRAQGVRVLSIDVEKRSDELDLIADIQDMPAVADESVDLVLCTQVLEHVPRPWCAVGEFSRVLRPGGRVVLSVPHLSAIHEAPHDYYRYTRYGLIALFREQGFEVLEVRATGGLIAFVSHGASMVLLGTLGAVPGLGRVVWAVHYATIRLLDPIDRILGMPSVYPAVYLLHARKPAGPPFRGEPEGTAAASSVGTSVLACPSSAEGQARTLVPAEEAVAR